MDPHTLVGMFPHPTTCPHAPGVHVPIHAIGLSPPISIHGDPCQGVPPCGRVWGHVVGCATCPPHPATCPHTLPHHPHSCHMSPSDDCRPDPLPTTFDPCHMPPHPAICPHTLPHINGLDPQIPNI